MISNPNDVLVSYLEQIADGIDGKEVVVDTNEDRIRHALGRIASHYGSEMPMANQAASTASSVSDAVADLNALIIKLKNAGLMTGDEFTMTVTKSVNDTFAGHADRQHNTDQIKSVAESDGVITITLKDGVKVADLYDFDGKGKWGVHKWLGIGISVGVNPITGLCYNGSQLTADDIAEATECELSAGYFVRWVAADLVLANDNSEPSKNYFTLSGSGYEKTTYILKIVEG